MGTYDGQICYVGQDHEAPDGRLLEGGWHYTVVATVDGSDETMPGEKLFSDGKGGYRLATDADQSHQEQHHQSLVLVAPEGNVGVPTTEEEYEATFSHLDQLEERINAGELDPHERHHMMTKPEHVATVRDWLTEARART